MIEKEFAHYKILRKLGKGGMGEVYLAQDTRLERTVAIKFLPEMYSNDREAIKRFQREAKATAALNHPNIITIHEINQYNNQTYIVMEHIKGQTLDRVIAGHQQEKHVPFSLESIIEIFIQICSGLSQAHQSEIIHRDIKPQNIMMGHDGRIKIFDFGMAKLKGVDKITRKHFYPGTLQYMSPEQINGEEPDQRSDIWAVGIVMYEMLSGQLPFTDKQPESLIHSILNKDPEFIGSLNPSIPRALADIIGKTLNKKREGRYQNIADMQNDLKAIIFEKREEDEQGFQVNTGSKISIAILPFADMSPEKDQEYFCDGLAEELINSLTKINGLRVTPRTSSFQFKGTDFEVHDITRKLQVDTVLEGSVQKSQNRLRITVKLFSVKSGSNLWSEHFDRELKDIFAIQDEISLAIISTLKIRFLGHEKVDLIRKHTQNIDAYNIFLKGRYFWNRRYEGGLKRSIDYYQQAIEMDPNYSLPYVGIADSLNILGFYGFMAPIEAYTKSKASVKKALQLEDDLSEAYASMGWINTFYDWDWNRAEQSFRDAIRFNPQYATAYEWRALYLTVIGKMEEAVSEAKKARDLDPLSLIINSVLGVIYIFSRRYDEARDQLSKILEMDPNFLLARIWMGETYLFKKHYEEAIGEFEKAVQLSEEMSYALADLGWAYAKAGLKNKAEEVIQKFEEIEKSRYVSGIQMGFPFLGLNEYDRVFELYEKAFSLRDPFLLWFKIAPHFDSIRHDIRFKKLIERVGLES